MRVPVLLLCAAVLAVACQPAGGPSVGPTALPRTGSERARLGAPDARLPTKLEELRDRTLLLAEEWQDEPVLSEVEVDVDEQHRWTQARAVYLAADADSFLSLVTAGSGFNPQRTTLSTLQVEPVNAEGLAQLPAFPDDALEPKALLESEDTRACGVAAPATVLYATGAPVAWDGMQWTAPPKWRATVTGDDGADAVFDVASGTGECVEE
ncbi:MAG: hypothetical protein GEU74_09945 [Nitriliruptorales bacterium]|nr:hypothetical protein [Nitriliruptorales bacterium]